MKLYAVSPSSSKNMMMVSSSSSSRALLVLKSSAATIATSHQRKFVLCDKPRRLFARNFSSKAAAAAGGGLPYPDIPSLAETARISLTQQEIEEVVPKIQQVIEWFGQLQAVDLESVEPAIRAETEGDNLRNDVPEVFENRDAMIASLPSYEEPYIKVPKVLNKE